MGQNGTFLKNFFKGVVAGIGGIAPGLSGSVLLVILGLYEQTVNAIGTLFLDFKKNIKFLLPLVLGLGVGILLFSKVVDFLLETFEFQTRYTFLGLILGPIPLFYREVKKKGFRKRYYFLIAVAAALGFFLFGFNRHLFPAVTEPNLLQSILLGVAVAGSSIVPGVDSAAIMSAFGLYFCNLRPFFGDHSHGGYGRKLHHYVHPHGIGRCGICGTGRFGFPVFWRHQGQ